MYRSLVRIAGRNPALANGLRRAEEAYSFRRGMRGELANLQTIEDFLLKSVVRIRAPLVLISQVQWSGGTLLSQLFDSHPSIAAHPHEIKIGYPRDEDWPTLDLTNSADRNFRDLFAMDAFGLIRRGYTKGRQNPNRLPYFLVPRIQYRIFTHLCETEQPKTRRDILDHYFSAYFNAWLNYRGHLGNAQWITGFAPRLANYKASIAGFFETYPDGRLIQIIRAPHTWYPSAKRNWKRPKNSSPESILAAWLESAEAICRNKNAYGDRVIVLRFSDLLENSARTMQMLAGELGIDYSPILGQPTFNGEPIFANSSFTVEAAGIIKSPLKRREKFNSEEARLIEERCLPLYEKVLSLRTPIGVAERLRSKSGSRK